MHLFVLGALVMFFIAVIAHTRSVRNLNIAMKLLLDEVHDNAYEVGKMQGRMEAMAVISEEADEYTIHRVRQTLDNTSAQ